MVCAKRSLKLSIESIEHLLFMAVLSLLVKATLHQQCIQKGFEIWPLLRLCCRMNRGVMVVPKPHAENNIP